MLSGAFRLPDGVKYSLLRLEKRLPAFYREGLTDGTLALRPTLLYDSPSRR